MQYHIIYEVALALLFLGCLLAIGVTAFYRYWLMLQVLKEETNDIEIQISDISSVVVEGYLPYSQGQKGATIPCTCRKCVTARDLFASYGNQGNKAMNCACRNCAAARAKAGSKPNNIYSISQ